MKIVKFEQLKYDLDGLLVSHDDFEEPPISYDFPQPIGEDPKYYNNIANIN